ncbi:MAG: sodium:calcium antiporter [Alphaproteobacteria bacterium PRO2]|nr:sodium:calcium antiporter [Alphaproteobacteria bacterium PRO2]
MIDFIMIAAGLVLLFFGGEGLIKGAVSLARNFGLSKLLVSAVIVGFGTSMPEMTVSVGAALKNSPEIALGNVVGSNIANILLIVAIATLIYPILIKERAVKRDAAMMITASVLLCGLALYGSLGFIGGLLMFPGLIAYIAWCYSQDRKNASQTPAHIEEDIEGAPLSVMVASFYSLAGLGLLVGGAYLLVEGAISLARDFGLSEAVIGLTIVAVGTSLPELATSIVAALRKHGDVIVGNILGSNIFNILAILGVTAMVKTIPMTGQIASTDVWIMLAVAFVFALPLWLGLRIGRGAGIAMLIAYCAYTAWLYTGAGG